jgi:hypothetical protein
VRVKINETRCDDHAGGVENFDVVCGMESALSADFLDDFAVEEHVECRVSFRGGIKDTAIFDQQHA